MNNLGNFKKSKKPSSPFHIDDTVANILTNELSISKNPGSAISKVYPKYSKKVNRHNDISPDSFVFNPLISKKKDFGLKPSPQKHTKHEDVDAAKLKEEYNKLLDKYLTLVSEKNDLESTNEKLKLLAYKSYNDVKEEIDYEISKATIEKDSLLILMELRENKKQTYNELRIKVTQPENLFLRLSELFMVSLIHIDKETEGFVITNKGNSFLKKRGL